jgi:DNA-binding HxlR family transcriptional regulator
LKKVGASLGEVKRYGQACPIARALDVVGDRWSLLIVRELIVGPRRYTDLMDGLPGIGTNVLAARLRDLDAAGIVTKRALPPPTPVTVYDLTEAGRELGRTLASLRTWGAQHAPPMRRDDEIRPAWVLSSATVAPRDLTPGKVCEIRVGSEVFRFTTEEARLALRAGPAERPDAVITLDTETLYALVTGRKTVQAVKRTSVIGGDQDLATEILTALYGAVTGRRP